MVFKKGNESPKKGKTWEEFYGEEKAIKIKKKLSEARIGKHYPKLSEAKKINNPSAFKSGKDNLMYGKHPSEKTRKKMKVSHKGIKHTKIAKRKISLAHQNLWVNLEYRKKMIKGMIVAWKRRLKPIGDKNPAWRGGTSFEPYSPNFNDDLKLIIKFRDNFTCQLCGLKENGQALHVHHINYNKKDSSILNLISLCPKCHGKTQFNREFWINKLNNFVGDSQCG